MDLKVGDKLICVKSDSRICKDEVVEISNITKGDIKIYSFKGYRTVYSEGVVKKMFKKFDY